MPGRRVLDIGAGTGDVLGAAAPRSGVGLNVSERLTELARAKFPALRFETIEADDLTLPDGFRPDYVLSVNLLDHTYDVYELFHACGNTSPRTR